MTTLLFTRGLPGSGKTTFARTWVADDPASRARVNKDDLRAMAHASVYLDDSTERQIDAIRDTAITSLLRAGIDVVCDDTNLPQSVADHLAQLATEAGSVVHVQDLTVIPLEVCIRQDAARPKPVGEEVIRRMHEQYLQGRTLPLPPPVPVPGLKLQYGATAAPSTPQTVFLAIGGDYDARWVRKVFAHRKDAEAYECGEDVEEWTVQPGPVETRTWIRALWNINDPAAADHEFDWINPLDMDGHSEMRDYDGRADALHIEWWPPFHPGPWQVRISGWDPALVTAAWRKRRDRMIAAGGELAPLIDEDERAGRADPA
ncbi:AAA family ATPase [Nonomuraea sp. NPDC003214]